MRWFMREDSPREAIAAKEGLAAQVSHGEWRGVNQSVNVCPQGRPGELNPAKNLKP